MGSHSTLKIRAQARLTSEARLLDLVRADGAEFGFRGGQYLIINTGLVAANGKAVKRAYSLLSSDREQSSARIAVKRIDTAQGSSFLHDVSVETELSFSGPWGKWSVDPAWNAKRILVVATDTAITAALGLAAASMNQNLQLDMLWFRESENYFLPDAFVRESLDSKTCLLTPAISPVGETRRVAQACRLVLEFVKGARYDAVFCAGDGDVIYPIRTELAAHGIPEERVLLESFFNNPSRKSA